jgi:iron complex outermembrane receptor protein
VKFNHHRSDVFGINLNSWFDWQLGRTAFGAEFRNEDIVSTNLGEALGEPFSHYKVGLNRSNLSFHLEHNILLKRFTLSAGFIAVKNTWNQMPFTIYPGIDASYRIGDHFKIYASYNSSLRMPSFTELYYSVGGHQADKYLKPEELRAVEGGVKYQSRLFSVKASIFHHHQRNTIDWVMDTRAADPIWQSVNLTRVNTFGQEITLTSHLSPLTSINVSYCHLHQSKDMPDYLQSQYALEYLRHKLTAQLQAHLFSRLDLTLCYRYQDRMGTYTDTSGQVQAYHPYSVVDSRLSWNADTYSIYIEGNNLLSHRYVDYGNVNQPGFWLMIGAKYHIAL